MSLSLANFSSNLGSLSTLGGIPGSFPRAVTPDVVRCDAFWAYSSGPEEQRCWEVWSMLPQESLRIVSLSQ